MCWICSVQNESMVPLAGFLHAFGRVSLHCIGASQVVHSARVWLVFTLSSVQCNDVRSDGLQRCVLCEAEPATACVLRCELGCLFL